MATKQGVLSEDDDQQNTSTDTNVEVSADDKQSQQKDKASQVEVVEDDGKGDERLDVTGAATDEKEERQHKETSKERRNRAKQARDRDRQELAYQRSIIDNLQRQIQSLSKQTQGTQISSLEEQLRQAQDEITRFEAIGRAAQEAKNIADTVQALRFEQAARERAVALKSQIDQAKRAPAQTSTRQPPPFMAQAQNFISRNPWYDPSGRDEDSAIVLAIDKVVAQEGFDPRTEQYWTELEKRIQKRLPHRFEEDGDDDDASEGEPSRTTQTTQTRKAPPVGGGRSTTGGGANVIRLSKERVDALKAANMWDDPATRARMAKRFSEWDKTNKNSAS